MLTANVGLDVYKYGSCVTVSSGVDKPINPKRGMAAITHATSESIHHVSEGVKK